MKTILIACAMTIAVSTSAMASAVPDLDAVSVVNEKNADVIQVAREKYYHVIHDRRMSSKEVSKTKTRTGRKHNRMKSAKDKRHTTYGTAKKRDVDIVERKAPHYKRKSPRQCKKGQTAKCK